MAIMGYHVVFCTYGFWLPNDPRGSGSDYVRNKKLLNSGKATKIDSTHSVAHAPHDIKARMSAKRLLKYNPVLLSGAQAMQVASGFKQACQEGNYLMFACCILPEHVHMVIGQHERNLNRIVGHLKTRATQALRKSGHWNDKGKPVWARSCWKAFLYSISKVKRVIDYVENNPVREGKKLQEWSFVEQYT